MEKCKRKILIATGTFVPDSGGPANYVNTLLKKLPDSDFDIKVITYADKENMKADDREYEPYEIARVYRSKNVILRYLKYFLKILSVVGRADLVYVQGPVSEGLPASLACRLRRKKYILKIVGDHAWEQGKQKYGIKETLDDFQDKINNGDYSWRVRLMRRIECFVARGAERIVVPSEYLKKNVIKWGIETDKIKVIYNSVGNLVEYGKPKEYYKNKLGLEGDIIVSVARLVKWKGFKALIDSMIKLREINPRYKLIIIDDGPERSALEEQVEKLNLGDHVKFLGRIDQKLLFEYIRAADKFVLNTAYEGLSHLIIETMQLGTPIVTTDVGGNPEIVHHEKTGLLVEFDNKEEIIQAILKLWKDEELTNRLTQKGKELVSATFNQEQMINGIKDLLKK